MGIRKLKEFLAKHIDLTDSTTEENFAPKFSLKKVDIKRTKTTILYSFICAIISMVIIVFGMWGPAEDYFEEHDTASIFFPLFFLFFPQLFLGYLMSKKQPNNSREGGFAALFFAVFMSVPILYYLIGGCLSFIFGCDLERVVSYSIFLIIFYLIISYIIGIIGYKIKNIIFEKDKIDNNSKLIK